MRGRAVVSVFVLSLTAAWNSVATGQAMGVGDVPPASRVAEPVGMLAYDASSPIRNRSEIYTIHSDGTRRRQLTTKGGWGPAWSADGSKIAYTTARDEIAVMNADGSGQSVVVTSGVNPTWSPEGESLSYECGAGFGKLCVWDEKTQRETVIVSGSEAWPWIGDPSWSPDGAWIAFTRISSSGDDYTNYRQIWLVRSDGSGLTAVPNTFPEGAAPTWSPDGSRLLYTERYNGRGGEGSADLFTVRPDGSERTQVTPFDGDDDDGMWSPDGQLIALTSSAGYYPDKYGIWLMTPEGLMLDFVVRNAGNPSWRPGFSTTPAGPPPAPISTGEPIAYVAATEAGFDLFTVRPDGTDLRRLTHHGAAHDPTWSPDHTKIVYRRGYDKVRVIDVETGEDRRVATTYLVEGFAWSPNGRRLAWGKFLGVTILNLRTGARRSFPIDRGCCGRDLAWSPDGSRLAVSQEFSLADLDIVTVSPSGADQRRVTRLPGEVVHLDWSPDGRRILFTHRHGPWWGRTVDVGTVRPGGKGQRMLVEGGGVDLSPAWSPDGGRIAFYSQGETPHGEALSTGLWTAGPRGGRRELVVADSTIAYVDW